MKIVPDLKSLLAILLAISPTIKTTNCPSIPSSSRQCLGKLNEIIESRLEKLPELIENARTDSIAKTDRNFAFTSSFVASLAAGAQAFGLAGALQFRKNGGNLLSAFYGTAGEVLFFNGDAVVNLVGAPNPRAVRACQPAQTLWTLLNKATLLSACNSSSLDVTALELRTRGAANCLLQLEDSFPSAAEFAFALDEIIAALSLRNQLFDTIDNELSEEIGA